MPIYVAGSSNAARVHAESPATTFDQSVTTRYLLRTANGPGMPSVDGASSSGGVGSRVPRCQAKITYLQQTHLKDQVDRIVNGPLAKVPPKLQTPVIKQVNALYQQYLDNRANVHKVLKSIAEKFNARIANITAETTADPKLCNVPVAELNDEQWDRLERYVNAQPASIYGSYGQPVTTEKMATLRLVICRFPNTSEGLAKAAELHETFEKVDFNDGTILLEQAAAASGVDHLVVNPDPSALPPGHNGPEAQQPQAASTSTFYVPLEENRAGPPLQSLPQRSAAKQTKAQAIHAQLKQFEATLQARKAELDTPSRHDRVFEKTLKLIDEDCQGQQALYPDIQFAALDRAALRQLRRLVSRYSDTHDLASVVQPRPNAAKTDVFLIRMPSSRAGDDIRGKFRSLQEAVQADPGNFPDSPTVYLKQYGIPYTHLNPDPGAAPLKAGGAANLSSFEVQTVTKAQTHPVSKPPPIEVAPAQAIASSSPAADPVTITYGPVFTAQLVQGLDEAGIKSFEIILDKLRSGGTPDYLAGSLAIYVIKMGDSRGKGQWRLYVDRAGGKCKIVGIYDNHIRPLKPWGDVSEAKAEKIAAKPDSVQLAAFRTPYVCSQATRLDDIYTIQEHQYVRIAGQGESLFRIEDFGEAGYRLCQSNGPTSASNTMLNANPDGTFSVRP